MTTSIHITANLLAVIDAALKVTVDKPVSVTITDSSITIMDSNRNKFWFVSRDDAGVIRISENDCVFHTAKEEDENW